MTPPRIPIPRGGVALIRSPSHHVQGDTSKQTSTDRRMQVLRQIYVDLVRRRSTVRIVNPVATLPRIRPIFVVGPYRSGTTLLRYVLDSHSHIACPPESDFLSTLSQLLGSTRSSRGLASMGYDEPHVAAKVNQLAEYFFANYAHSRGKERWADKSPTYAGYLPFIRTVFPHAQFVFIHRSPLDQIHSHTKGGTHSNSFIEAHRHTTTEDLRLAGARYWVEASIKIRQFAMDDPFSFQLRYEDVCASPTETLQPLFAFLGEEWEEAVLDYHIQPHDLGMEAARARSSRGFTVSTGGFVSWPSQIVEECSEIVAETASALGYAAAAMRVPTASALPEVSREPIP